ncbi:MAG: Uncharacterized protein FD146_1121 [Anaerolineaceae bacterium]|nr:MAG: Uncharacterized protein FD146_1121 [Anaerolineaceae bacterium]
MTAPALWLLTGPRGAGKTLFCRRFAEHARAAGWEAAGLLSPAVFENGVKTGILAENLQTGETRPLASAASRPPFDLQLGDWFFDRAALDWGSRVLEDSLPCDLLIVDELGPLELLRAAGWASALPALRQTAYRLGLIVVRTELAANARAALPVAGTIHLDRSSAPEAEALRWWEQLSGDSPA